MNRFKLKPEPCTAGPFKGYLGIDWINSAAKRNRETVFNNLLHHLNEDNLRQAYRQLQGNKAVGIDRTTKQQYGRELKENLEKLSDEIYRGGWRPRPSREVLIPKPQGGFRPIAIGCFEDKIVQQVMAKILEAIFEPEFHHHSYGFRPGRNTHQALSKLYQLVNERADRCFIVEMDIEKFFNKMNHEKLMTFIETKISDHHVLRLIRRMLRNSILNQDGVLSKNELGTPQGAPVSPVLANIYLHFTLDLWFQEQWADKGEMVRYADDAVFVFSSRTDAEEFHKALILRMQNFGNLNLNLDKSGTFPFNTKSATQQLPFLGFNLYWGLTAKKRKLLKVKTAPKKLGKCIEAFSDWIKANRSRLTTEKIWKQTETKLQGHYQYYGVSYNRPKLYHYYYAVVGLLYRWMNRRSQKRSFTWEQYLRRLAHRKLPMPPWPKALRDITMGIVSELKHKTRSRMRKLRTYGSYRSRGWQQPLFT